jgi:PIN domain nuclease of toxin-antitoxin system
MSRFLLDSHVLLWWLDGADRLAEPAMAAISEGDNDVIVSVATIWELTIKQASGKLRIDGDLRQQLREQWFDELPITGRHAAEVEALPPHHRDPFDRLLIAQARCEGLTIVTADQTMNDYDVPVLAAERTTPRVPTAPGR